MIVSRGRNMPPYQTAAYFLRLKQPYYSAVVNVTTLDLLRQMIGN